MSEQTPGERALDLLARLIGDSEPLINCDELRVEARTVLIASGRSAPRLPCDCEQDGHPDRERHASDCVAWSGSR